VSATRVVLAIVHRDLIRAGRQKSRLIGGLSRPFMWLLLVGAGFNTIARVDGAGSYQLFVFPGVVVMASLFGGMLTAISTVYDREFGMLRLMLASPAGVPAVLAGRALAAAAIGSLQGAIVLATAPLLLAVTVGDMASAALVLVLASFCSALLGLVVAAPLRSVENFAGIINVVLFPILFLSGALYPTTDLPVALKAIARLNPITYAVDLMRGALHQPTEFTPLHAWLAIAVACGLAFAAAAILFDPERRFTSPRAATRS
jgi:ABC-2 type transport system permease protein